MRAPRRRRFAVVDRVGRTGFVVDGQHTFRSKASAEAAREAAKRRTGRTDLVVVEDNDVRWGKPVETEEITA